MSRGIDRAREELLKAKIILRRPERYVADAAAEAIQLGRQRRRDRDMAEAVAEAFRRAGLLPSHIEPETPLPDVPLHKRGFGVMDEDAP